MSTRLQFTISDAEAETVFKEIHTIAPRSRAIVRKTTAPSRENSQLLIVLTDDEDIEFMLRLKYTGYETRITRF
jgi:hypothetical protein